MRRGPIRVAPAPLDPVRSSCAPPDPGMSSVGGGARLGPPTMTFKVLILVVLLHCGHQLSVIVAQSPPTLQRNFIPRGLAPPCGDIIEASVTSSHLHSIKEFCSGEKLLPLHSPGTPQRKPGTLRSLAGGRADGSSSGLLYSLHGDTGACPCSGPRSWR